MMDAQIFAKWRQAICVIMQFYHLFASQFVEMERTCQVKFVTMEMSQTLQIVNQIVWALSVDISVLEEAQQLLEPANKYVEMLS